MSGFRRPKVVVSRCLEFDEVRYNGDMLPDQVIRDLKPYVDFIPVCPEVEIGLGIPRDVIRIVKGEEGNKLVQPSTGEDLTDRMNSFTESFLDQLPDIDGFILKNRSPTCGMKGVKVYAGNEKSPVVEKTAGFFAKGVLDRYEGKAIEEEGRLKNHQIREHFFTKLFTIAWFRDLTKEPTMKGLVDFHGINKYLFMSYNQKELKAMGKIVANHEKKPVAEVFAEYEPHLAWLFRQAPSVRSNVNVCQHIMGYFKKELSQNEKQFFLEELDRYYEKKIPLSTILAILKSWVIRFNNDYLNKQSYFEPYPVNLVEITDSGKGRDYR